MRKSLKIAIIALFAILLLMIGIKVEKGDYEYVGPRHTIVWYTDLRKNDDNTKVYLTLNDLITRANILCSAYGVHLISENNIKLASYGDLNTIDGGNSTGYLTSNSHATIYKYKKGNNGLYSIDWSSWNIIEDDGNLNWDASTILNKIKNTKNDGAAINSYTITTSETYALYTPKSTRATPKQAYILSRTPEIKIDDYHNYSSQQAWWRLNPFGENKDPYYYENSLYKEADQFEKYICQVVAGPGKSPVDVSSLEYDNDDYVKIPEYTVSKGTNYKKENVKALFDSSSNRYIIGPFSIKYVSASYGTTVFAGITGAEVKGIYLDTSGKEKEDNIVGYSFLDNKGTSISSPDSDTDFYVSIPYVSNLVSITNIKFNFKYMNARGRYEKLEGSFNVIGWQPQTDIECFNVQSLNIMKDFCYLANNPIQSTYKLGLNNIGDENQPFKISIDENNVVDIRFSTHLQQQEQNKPIISWRDVTTSDLTDHKTPTIELNSENISITYSDDRAVAHNIEIVECNVRSSNQHFIIDIELKIKGLPKGGDYKYKLGPRSVELTINGEQFENYNASLPIEFSTIKTHNVSSYTLQQVETEVENEAQRFKDADGIEVDADNSNKHSKNPGYQGNNNYTLNFDNSFYYYRYVHYLSQAVTKSYTPQVLINLLLANTKTIYLDKSLEFQIDISFKTSLRWNGMVR